MRFGHSIVPAAVAYPFLVYATVWIHYAIAHCESSRRTGSFLFLLAFPVYLGCVSSMVIFLLDGRGKKRIVGIVEALMGNHCIGLLS